MNEDILNTIEVLTNKIRVKEEEANKLKKLVNELCIEAGAEARYSDVAESGAGVTAIRADQFYGQTLTAAIRNYLERRKTSGLGAASVPEIYRAIKEGGYKFETNREENAKISVGNALRKTSSIFHRLPNGHFGLLAWYPSAKSPEEATRTKRRKRVPAKIKGLLPERAESIDSETQPTEKNGNGAEAVTQKEIRDVILDQKTEFSASDIESAVKAKFPSKTLPKTKIPSVIFVLTREKGILRQISPRVGAKGAIYAKA
jgi:hypothetical protein